jgi:hypothetical protein
MPEKIFLTYTNATAVPYQGTVLGHHIVLNYIDSNGWHHMLQGVPEHRFDHNLDKLIAFSDAELASDDAKRRDSPFQRLKADPERTDTETSLNRPHTMVAEADDLSSRWALMNDFADEVNSTGYEYRPVSQNSNSFAGGALQRAGFFGPGTKFPERFDRQLVFDPVSGETRSFKVPGFEKSLANPINTETPMPFPLSGSVAPDGVHVTGQPPLPVRRLVGRIVDDPQTSAFDSGAPAALSPSNGFPVSDRGDSFGDRFGNWASTGAGDTPQQSLDSAPSYGGIFHQYLNQLAAGRSQAPASAPGINALSPYQSFSRNAAPPDDPATTGNGSIEKWIASLAGVDPNDPTQFQVPPIFSPLYRR